MNQESLFVCLDSHTITVIVLDARSIEFGGVIRILYRIIVIGDLIQIADEIFQDGCLVQEKALKLAGVEMDVGMLILVALIDLDKNIKRGLPILLDLIH